MTLIDLSITYSIGGSEGEAEPLLRRTVPYVVDLPDAPSPLEVQEALLERTDRVLTDLCQLFDETYDMYEREGRTKSLHVQIMMGACSHAVKILSCGPSTAYALMFLRVQKLLNLKEHIAMCINIGAAKTMETFVLPLWETMRAIDSTFANTGM